MGAEATRIELAAVTYVLRDRDRESHPTTLSHPAGGGVEDRGSGVGSGVHPRE
jgi:hypothetical protein